MARSSTTETIEKFGKASVGVKAAVLLGVLLVLGGSYYYFFYSEMQGELSALQRERAKLTNEQESLRKRKRDFDVLRKQKEELEDEVKKNAVKLPASSELPAFFVHLQAQALRANVRLVKWSREKEEAIENYVKVPVKMEVQGTFYQLNQYFELVYQTPRIITIENLKIGDGVMQGDELTLTAGFTASTFRQADQPPADAAPAAAPKGSTPAPGPAPDAPKDATGTKAGTAPTGKKPAGGKAPTKGGGDDLPDPTGGLR